jgi:hypothetical protein
MSTRMTPEQVQYFHDMGFVAPKIRIPEAVFAPIQETCAKIFQENAGKPDIIRQVYMPKREGYPPDEGNPHHEPLFKFAFSPSILDPVEQILGPDLIIFTAIMFAKPKGVGKEVPWHQDGHYTPVRPLDAVTVWIALEDVDVENGCVRFIPGSHKQGLLPHMQENRTNISTTHSVDRQYFDPATAVDCELKAGEFSIHGEYVIHGSNPNVSNRSRVGLAYRYFSAKSHYDRTVEERGGSQARAAAVTSRWPIWVVRGQNRNPKNDLVRGHEGMGHYDAIAAEAVRRSAKQMA